MKTSSLRTKGSAIFAAVAIAGGLLSVLNPTSAHAATTTSTPLPLAGAADVVAVGDRVFVSGGRASTSIVVTDALGAVTGALNGLSGPSDLLVSDDQSTLYVAQPQAKVIVAFDTGSLAEVARYSTGSGVCPGSLALSGGRLFFGYGCDQWGGNIGRVDLAAQPAVVTVGLVAENYWGSPMLAAAADNPAVLLAAQPSLSPASLTVYSVADGGALTFARRSEHTALGSNLRDLAIDPAGTTAYLAQGSPYVHQAYSVDDLNGPVHEFLTTAYPNAVEVSRDGGYLAAGSDAAYKPDIFVFGIDGTAVDVIELGRTLRSGALAWSPDGRRIYSITTDVYGEAPALHVSTLAAS